MTESTFEDIKEDSAKKKEKPMKLVTAKQKRVFRKKTSEEFERNAGDIEGLKEELTKLAVLDIPTRTEEKTEENEIGNDISIRISGEKAKPKTPQPPKDKGDIEDPDDKTQEDSPGIEVSRPLPPLILRKEYVIRDSVVDGVFRYEKMISGCSILHMFRNVETGTVTTYTPFALKELVNSPKCLFGEYGDSERKQRSRKSGKVSVTKRLFTRKTFME